MNATIFQTDKTGKANRIEEGLHHQIDALQDEMLGLTIVNSKPDMGSKTAIEMITITIEIKTSPTVTTDMGGMEHEEMIMVHEEMIIGDVT